jgi:hypothetical protein
MPHNQTSFKQGQGGRTNGSRNRRNSELWDLLEQRGDKDPALFLSEIVTNENNSKELRVQAAGQLMPYKYAKVTPPAAQVFVQTNVNLITPQTQQDARNNISYLTSLKASGHLDLVAADSLIADQVKLLDSFNDETKLLVAGKGPAGELHIRIDGGLPALPGTNISMPYGTDRSPAPSHDQWGWSEVRATESHTPPHGPNGPPKSNGHDPHSPLNESAQSPAPDNSPCNTEPQP